MAEPTPIPASINTLIRIGALIAAVTIFVSGVFEGYTHPKKCSDE